MYVQIIPGVTQAANLNHYVRGMDTEIYEQVADIRIAPSVTINFIDLP
jgi:hypothetical protein